MPGLRTTACAAALASSLKGPTTKVPKVNRGFRLLFWCTASSGSSPTGGWTTRASPRLGFGAPGGDVFLARGGSGGGGRGDMTYRRVRRDWESVRSERSMFLGNLVESQSRATCDGPPSDTAPKR